MPMSLAARSIRLAAGFSSLATTALRTFAGVLLPRAAVVLVAVVAVAAASGDEAVPVDASPQWWKGNIHTHTFWSDGNDFPEMVAEWYRTRDYNFLALTDHNVLAQGIRWIPEKRALDLDSKSLAHLFHLNTIGPTMVAKHMLPLLDREERSVFAALSARVGSISDNRLGGWHSYRASKAALNMILRTLSVELAYKNPGAICVALHPGTVDTGLSKPFQKNVPDEKLFTPRYAATQMLSVLDSLSPQDTGGFFAWDGKPIAY